MPTTAVFQWRSANSTRGFLGQAGNLDIFTVMTGKRNSGSRVCDMKED
ncbi:MAG: hypothetical protein QGF00_31550 [Planctomycetota bacterium]|nr:hypothetical protein [Planctomycetota bacterium]